MGSATEKQLDFIIRLYNETRGTTHGYLSQCKGLGLSQRQRKGGMTKAEASAIIEALIQEREDA